MGTDEKKEYLNEYILTYYALKRTEKQIHLFGDCEEYRVQLNRYNYKLKKFKDEVDLVPDTLCREILIQKYFMGYTLSKIADALKYSRRHIERLHRKALEQFNVL